MISENVSRINSQFYTKVHSILNSTQTYVQFYTQLQHKRVITLALEPCKLVGALHAAADADSVVEPYRRPVVPVVVLAVLSILVRSHDGEHIFDKPTSEWILHGLTLRRVECSCFKDDGIRK